MLKLHRLVPAFLILSALLLATVPVRAMDCPDPMSATIASLHDCVQHAADMGYIDTSGVAQSLLAKLDAAQAALDSGQKATAVNILNAFIADVRAQSGIHIEAEHAAHMVTHAQMVIAALA